MVVGSILKGIFRQSTPYLKNRNKKNYISMMMKIIKEEHAIKPKVTLLFNFRFHYITSVTHRFFCRRNSTATN